MIRIRQPQYQTMSTTWDIEQHALVVEYFRDAYGLDLDRSGKNRDEVEFLLQRARTLGFDCANHSIIFVECAMFWGWHKNHSEPPFLQLTGFDPAVRIEMILDMFVGLKREAGDDINEQ